MRKEPIDARYRQRERYAAPPESVIDEQQVGSSGAAVTVSAAGGLVSMYYPWVSHLAAVKDQVRELDKRVSDGQRMLEDDENIERCGGDREADVDEKSLILATEAGPYGGILQQLAADLDSLKSKKDERGRRLEQLQQDNLDLLDRFRQRRAMEQSAEAGGGSPTVDEKTPPFHEHQASTTLVGDLAGHDKDVQGMDADHRPPWSFAAFFPSFPPSALQEPIASSFYLSSAAERSMTTKPPINTAGDKDSYDRVGNDGSLSWPLEKGTRSSSRKSKRRANEERNGLVVAAEGWLMVAEGEVDWRPRWCQLVDHGLVASPELLVFLSDHHTDAVYEEVSVGDAMNVSSPATVTDHRGSKLRADKCTFEITYCNGNSRLFQAENDGELDRWTSALREILDLHRQRSRCTPSAAQEAPHDGGQPQQRPRAESSKHLFVAPPVPASLDTIARLVTRMIPVLEGVLYISNAASSWNVDMISKYFRLFENDRAAPFLCCYSGAECDQGSMSGFLPLHSCIVRLAEQGEEEEERVEGFYALEIVRPEGMSILLYEEDPEVVKSWVATMQAYIAEACRGRAKGGGLSHNTALLEEERTPTTVEAGARHNTLFVDDDVELDAEEGQGDRDVMSTLCSTWAESTLGDFNLSLRHGWHGVGGGNITLRDMRQTLGEFEQHLPAGPTIQQMTGQIFQFGEDTMAAV